MHIFHSYRWRRRMIIWGLTIGISGPLIYLGVHYSHGADKGNPTGPSINPKIFAQPKSVPFTGEEQRAVRPVLAKFISTAVARRHVAQSWPVVGPDLREGLTRRQWSRGNIPVQNYPVSTKGLGSWQTVEFSYPGEVGLEVLLYPKRGAGQPPLSVDIDVKKDRFGRWRVNYFMPKKYHGIAPASVTPAKSHGKKNPAARKFAAPRPAASESAFEHKVSKGWWAIPLGVFALVVLIPISVVLAVWIRNRRAEAKYQHSHR